MQQLAEQILMTELPSWFNSNDTDYQQMIELLSDILKES